MILFRRVSFFPLAVQQQLSHYLGKLPDSTIVVMWDCGTVDEILAPILDQSEKIFDVSQPNSQLLRLLALKEVKQRNWQITQEEIDAILENESNLWRVVTQLKIAALGGETLSSKERGSDERFIYYRLFRQGDHKAISDQIIRDYTQGKPLDLLIGELTSVVKKEVNDGQFRLQLVDTLISIDFGRKTGQLGDRDAVTLLVVGLAKNGIKPLQWERLWQEK